MSRPAVFLDRDGVLNETVPDATKGGQRESPYNPVDVRLAPGVAAGLARLRAAGFALVVVSNQPAAAKGIASLEELEAVRARVDALLAQEGEQVDGWYACHHHPESSDPDLAIACDCRKPAPGLLLRAAAELDLALEGSWMVGDSDSDVEAGRRAGCRTVLVEHPGSAHRRHGEARPNHVAADLAASADAVVAEAVR